MILEPHTERILDLSILHGMQINIIRSYIRRVRKQKVWHVQLVRRFYGITLLFLAG